jgi:NADPH:quinone reductase-like Zn-dependent oxidoreductase
LKAVRIHAHGGIDQLRYEDTKEPQLRSGNDVIVKLKTAALNRVDLDLRAGNLCAKKPLPRILGVDGAGTVFSVGAEVSSVKPGDAVCLYPISSCGACAFCVTEQESLCNNIRLPGKHSNGTYAEYVRVPAKNCFVFPSRLSFEEAAAFPLVYLTVWRMLVTHTDLKPGGSVLIVGAGGGISTAALHIAGAIGARIFVASSDRGKLSAAEKFGAHALYSRSSEFAKAVRALTHKRGVDLVVNCVGGDTWRESLAALARGGRLVTCGAVAGALPKTDLRRVFWNHLKILAANGGTRQEFFRLLNFWGSSNRKPIIDKVFSLKDARWAHNRLEERKQFGKIVLRIDE